MNIFQRLWETIQGNSKSVRLVFTTASIILLLNVFTGAVSSSDATWTVEGQHWALEQYIFDIFIAGVVCLIVQSLCWMDTIRPLDKTNLAKQKQLAKKDDVEAPASRS